MPQSKTKQVKAKKSSIKKIYVAPKNPIRKKVIKNKYGRQHLISLRFPKKFTIPLALIIVVAISSIIYLLKDLPSPTTLGKKDFYPVSTKIYDRNGELLYEIFDDQNRTPVEIESLPQHVIQATISVEDKNFFKHHGFDTQGILRAAWRTITGQRLEGGSTITQQLVKVTLLTPERTIERKIKEAVLSLATEVLYTKNDILELYLNHIPYGGTAYGIEAASQLYFSKPSSGLTLSESALLAGLPQAPTRYSPFYNPESAKLRQSQVLDRMVAEGFITEDDANNAKNEPLEYSQPFTDIKAPHFVMYVRQQLEEEYGIQRLEQGGLRVTTTLDLDLQEAAEASLSSEIDDLANLRVSNGAALITNPKTGEIYSMIGSRDYFDDEIDGKVNVTTRERQPGSSIKPLNYALGIESKTITPSTILLDTPICFRVVGQQDYCPKNYDNSFRGITQIRYALANSYNIPAVKVLALNGIENFISFASRMGISTWGNSSDYGLSLTLGGGEVTMVDMATAFGVFANNGTKVPLESILKVETYTGEVLDEYNTQDAINTVDSNIDSVPGESSNDQFPKVLSRQTSYLISHILSDNNARSAAFGTSSVLNIPGKKVAVKTGTTNNLRDNWTIGYTNNLLVSVWVGNNDNTPMSYVASGITGASPIWQDLMLYALDDDDTLTLDTAPEGVTGALVCSDSGTSPSAENSCPTRFELFLTGTTPQVSTISKRTIWINKDTKRPPANEEEFGNIEEQEHLVASDPFVSDYCLDCEPLPEDQQEKPTLVQWSGTATFNE